jgi:hypothetical protein
MAEETKQWDYRVQNFGSTWTGAKPEDIETALLEWGIEGWEVVSVYKIESGHKVTIVAKRPLTHAIMRARSMPSD